jgi:hypothetical protein
MTKYLNPRCVKESEFFLNELHLFSKKASLTNYNFGEYFEAIKNNNIKFIPGRGIDYSIKGIS